MPPKRAPKLHELSTEVKAGHKITDLQKREFIIEKQFATGGFGRIHTCHQSGSSKQLVMKIEPQGNGPLFTEVKVFQRILKQDQIQKYEREKKVKRVGLPYLISTGIFDYQMEKMRYMIIPKYEVSLEHIRTNQNGTLTVSAAMQVAEAVLVALDYMHYKDYTHADIKAANILLEYSKDFSTAVLVDFGLARFSAKIEDKPDKKRAHNGTCIFTSIDAHDGNNPSYRGDIEILAYNLIYWITGTLPWLEHESSPSKVHQLKKTFMDGLPQTLKTEIKNMPSALDCIRDMLKLVKKAKYAEKIDTSELKQIIKKTGSEKSSVKKINTTPTRRRADKKKLEDVEVEKSTVQKRKTVERRVLEEEDEDDESFYSVKSSITPLRQTQLHKASSLAKSISSKYKRRSSVKLAKPLVLESKDNGKVEKVVLKTKAVVKSKAPSRSGITDAEKASPTKLRKVPGMLNFPKGRRSELINEIVTRYRTRLAAANDINNSS